MKKIIHLTINFFLAITFTFTSCTFHFGQNTRADTSDKKNETEQERNFSLNYFDGECEKIFEKNTNLSFTDLYESSYSTFFNTPGAGFTGSEYIVDFVKTDDGHYYFRFTDCSSSDNNDWLTYWYLFIGQQNDDCFFIPVKEDGKSYPKADCITGFKIIDPSRMKIKIYGKEILFESYLNKSLPIQPTKPAVRGIYLSNFQGKYDLTNDFELEISSKINLKSSVNKYWFSHVIGCQYSSDGEYNFLLCHESNTDPGITGNEPFVSRQGLFYSRMSIKMNKDSWTVCWSSKWADFPHDAFSLDLDMKENCPATPVQKNHYKYDFFLANPVLGSDGFYTVEKGPALGSYSLDTYDQKNFTLKDLLENAGINTGLLEIPDDMEIETWWYSTNSITGRLESFKYPLTDESEINYGQKEIYLALKEKVSIQNPPSQGFVPTGTYTPAGAAWEGFSLIVEGSTGKLVYPGGEKQFEIIPDFKANPNFQDFGGDYPNIRIFNLDSKYRIKIYKSSKSGTTILEWPK